MLWPPCQTGGVLAFYGSAAMMRRVAAGRLPRTMSSFSMMIGSPSVDWRAAIEGSDT